MVRLVVAAALLLGCGGGRVRGAGEAPRAACHGWGLRGAGSGAAPGQVQGIPRQLAGKRLVRVAVRGNRAVPAELVLAAVKLRAGARVDREAIAADLRRVWALESFSDVGAELAAEARGAALTWVVVERPLVGRVFVHGPGRRRLRALAGGIHDPVRVARVADAVRVRLQEQGYLNAAVRTGARPAGERIDLCVAVEPGTKFALARIDFPGSRRIAADELRATLSTHEGQVNAPGGLYRADLLEVDRLRMLALYWDRGMVDARIGEPVVTRDPARGRLTVALPVHEGPVYRLGRLQVTGAPPAEHARLLGPLASGRVFVRAQVAEAEARMRAWLSARGGGDQVQPITAVDVARRTIDITFALGER